MAWTEGSTHATTLTRLVPTRRFKRRAGNTLMQLALCFTGSVLATLGASTLASAAPPLTTVTVNVFPGGFCWPTYVARDEGLFARQGISVEVQNTTGSVAQMTGLSQGEFDIAITAIDNIVAYVEGEGEAPIGPQPDFVSLMGSDSSFLSLVAQPNITSYAQLRGTTLSVDALTTGYAFVLFDMMRRQGLKMDDYRLQAAGGMVQRYDALLQGTHSATLLSSPFNILARNKGLHQLARATDVIGPYQGNVAATRRSWATQHRREVIAFIRGYVQAIDWLYDPAHHDEAIKVLMHNVPGMSPELAELTYKELLDPQTGFFKKGKINLQGIRTVLELRSRYASQHKKLTEPMKYYDGSYYKAAMRR